MRPCSMVLIYLIVAKVAYAVVAKLNLPKVRYRWMYIMHWNPKKSKKVIYLPAKAIPKQKK